MTVSNEQVGWLKRTVAAVARPLGQALGWQTASAAWSRQIADWLGTPTSAAEVTRPVAQSVHAYRAIGVCTHTVASLPPVLRIGNDGDPLEHGPAYELVHNPDSAAMMTWRELAEELVGHLLASGAAFALDADMVEHPGDWNGQAPTRLVIVGQTQMRPHYAADHTTLLWWELRERPGAKPLPIPPNIAPYIRLFNPYDPWLGLSPLEPAWLAIKQDYKAASFNVAALDNGGQPGGLYVFADGLGDEQREEYYHKLRERHAQPGNANKPGILEGGVTWQPTSFNMTDLALNESRKLSREEIFEAFGVPPVLGCVFDAAHYNVADAAQEIFLLNTILPITEKVAAMMTKILDAVQPGVVLELDTSTHPVMQRIERQKHDSLTKLMSTGVPYNEAVASLGLPFGEQPWGNRSLLAMGLAAAEDVIAGTGGGLPETEEQPVDEDESPDDEAGRPVENRSHKSRPVEDRPHNYVASIARERRVETQQIRAAVNPIRQRMRGLFVRQEKALVARLKTVVGDPDRARRRAWETADDDDEAARVARRVLLRLTEQQSALKKIAQQVIPRAIENTLRAELKRLGMANKLIDAAVKRAMSGGLVRAAIARKTLHLQGVELTTRRRVQAQLIHGIRRGESVVDLAKRIRTVLGGDNNYARATLIARVEAGQAVSIARFTAAKASGATGKMWMAGRNPRPSHFKAGNDYTKGRAIPIDQPFRVGQARLMYPRDPSGPAGETINCNCVMLSVRLTTAGGEARIVNMVGAATTNGEAA